MSQHGYVREHKEVKMMKEIKINKWMVEDINEEYSEGKHAMLKLYNGIGETSVINQLHGNWEVCKVSEITELIDNLTRLRDILSEETGIDF